MDPLETSGETILFSNCPENEEVPAFVFDGNRIVLNYNRGVQTNTELFAPEYNLSFGKNIKKQLNQSVVIFGENNNVFNSRHIAIFSTTGVEVNNCSNVTVLSTSSEGNLKLENLKDTLVTRNILSDGKVVLSKEINKPISELKSTLTVEGGIKTDLLEVKDIVAVKTLKIGKSFSEDIEAQSAAVKNLQTASLSCKTVDLAFSPKEALSEFYLDGDNMSVFVNTSRSEVVINLEDDKYQDGWIVVFKIFNGIEANESSYPLILKSKKYLIEDINGIKNSVSFRGNLSSYSYIFNKSKKIFFLRAFIDKSKQKTEVFPLADEESKNKLLSLL
jgi:hypothetical protein